MWWSIVIKFNTWVSHLTFKNHILFRIITMNITSSCLQSGKLSFKMLRNVWWYIVSSIEFNTWVSQLTFKYNIFSESLKWTPRFSNWFIEDTQDKHKSNVIKLIKYTSLWALLISLVKKINFYWLNAIFLIFVPVIFSKQDNDFFEKQKCKQEIKFCYFRHS